MAPQGVYRHLAVLCACAMLAAAAATPIPRMFRGRPAGGMLNAGYPRDVAAKYAGGLPPNVQELYATQSLDHFNPQNTQTFQERYFVNSQYWDKATGPIFLMLGGEAAQDPVWAVESDMVGNAKKLNALIVLSEHRFYGKSQPFSDLSTEHLQFLTSEQALADYAHLIDHVRTTFGATANNPVVAFGGSYSGALAGWLRLKYPSHVIGSVATSSPVVAVLDFVNYMVTVSDSLSNTDVGGSSQCVDTITQGLAKMKTMLATPTGASQLGKMFNTCSDLGTASTIDVTNFYSNVIGLFAGVVQYNGDNRAFEGATHTNITIDVVCDTLTKANSDPLTQWAAVNQMLSGAQCTSFNYSEMIMAMRDTSLTAPAAAGGRQWTYQTCAEFGFYQTTDSPKQPFGDYLPLSFSIQQCEDIFGSMFDQTFIQGRVNFTLEHYGGRDLLGTNIMVPNGNIDPWHTLSVLEPNAAYNISTILIEDGAHCSNMYPPSPNDSKYVLAARKQIYETLAAWVAAAQA